MTDSLDQAGQKVLNHCADNQKTILNKNELNEQSLIDLYLSISN